MNCPLCLKAVNIEQSISTSDIVMFWNNIGVSVSRLFAQEKLDKSKCLNCGLSFYSPISPGDDAFYSKLATWDWYYKHSGKTEYEFSAKLLEPGMEIMDVGCGIGEFSTYIPKDSKFFGLELSSKSVEIAQSLGRNVKQDDIIAYSSGNEGKFDVVTCFQVLEHITEIDSFVKALIKICRPGGLIVIAVPNNDGFISSAVNSILNMPPHHVLLWNKSSLYYLAKKYELTIIDYMEERVTEVHRKWFFVVYINKYLHRLLGFNVKLIDTGLLSKVTHKLSSLIATPLSAIYPKPNASGLSSIIVLRRGTNA